jgi:HEAT repeat protein
MRPEHPPKIKTEKETEQTAETPTDETLFEGFYSLERPTLGGLEKLGKELSEYSEFKPKLTFLFGLSENRRNAIEMVRTNKINQEQVINLIKSQDFIERGAGIYLLDKIEGLSSESIEQLRTFLANRRWKGKDKELAEKIKVKIILKTEGEDALDVLLKMSKEKGWENKRAVAEGLGELGDEKALPILEKLCGLSNKYWNPDKYWNPEVMKAAARAKAKIILKTEGEKALPVLSEMFLGSRFWPIQMAAAEALGNIPDKKVIDVLKKTDWNALGKEGENVKQTSARAIINIIRNIAEREGEEATPVLKEMCRDKNTYVSWPAAQVLARLIIKTRGEKADETLKETFKDYDEGLKEAVDFEKNKHQWLLGTQKPLFATAHTKELVGGLKDMQKISKQLREKCGDKFIGLTVFGSASKGYFKKSDIDFAVIIKEGVMEKIYQHLNKEITPNHNYEYHGHIEIGENNDVLWGEEPSGLFKGIFLATTIN